MYTEDLCIDGGSGTLCPVHPDTRYVYVYTSLVPRLLVDPGYEAMLNAAVA